MPLSADERRDQRRYPLYLLALGALLYLPRLGGFGFWDPSEVRVADVARSIFAPKAPAIATQHVTTVQQLVAVGFRTLGIGELGGRLPLALLSLLALLVAYWAARSVLRPRAALIGSLALATTPAVLFGARQLTSQAPLLLATTLAVGGLARLGWPTTRSGLGPRLLAALAALAGLTLGVASGGALVGGLAPLITVAIALAVSNRRRAVALLVWAASLALGVAVALAYRKRGVYSLLLGGIPRAPQFQTVVTTIVRPLGFSSLPWIAIAPFGILRAVDTSQPTHEEDEPDRALFARALLPTWLAITYLTGTLHNAIIGDLLVPAAPAIALLAGAYLDGALLSPGLRRFEGVAIGTLAVVLGHDVLLATEALVSANSLEVIRWPVQLYGAAQVLFGLLALFGVLLGTGLALPDAWPRKEGVPGERAQQRLILAALAAQVLFSLALAQWVIPAASKHLSPKDLYGKTKQLDPTAPLGQYRFNASGAAYYMGGRTAVALNTYAEVLEFLKRPERVFVFVGSEELAGIDQATRGGSRPVVQGPSDGAAAAVAPPRPPSVQYVVVDDSNSHFLILSNRIGPGETDLNPLRRFVSETPPKPQTPLAINFEDKLAFLGYDLPTTARRGEDVRVRLYFKVLAPVGASYKIFLHFDGPGARVNGDHVPLDGRFATQFWTPGTYVTDEYLLKPDRATQPTGPHQLYFGLFSGDKRMKVKDGASDGDNRVRLGSVRVQ